MQLLEKLNIGNNSNTIDINSSIILNNNLDLVIELVSVYNYSYNGFVYQVFKSPQGDFNGNWERLYVGRQHYQSISFNSSFPYFLSFRLYKGADSVKIWQI